MPDAKPTEIKEAFDRLRSKLEIHYRALEVKPDAEAEEIKSAYKKLQMMYHPDKNPSPMAAGKIRDINNAYEILSDQAKRNRYDQSIADELPEIIQAYEILSDPKKRKQYDESRKRAFIEKIFPHGFLMQIKQGMLFSISPGNQELNISFIDNQWAFVYGARVKSWLNEIGFVLPDESLRRLYGRSYSLEPIGNFEDALQRFKKGIVETILTDDKIICSEHDENGLTEPFLPQNPEMRYTMLQGLQYFCTNMLNQAEINFEEHKGYNRLQSKLTAIKFKEIFMQKCKFEITFNLNQPKQWWQLWMSSNINFKSIEGITISNSSSKAIGLLLEEKAISSVHESKKNEAKIPQNKIVPAEIHEILDVMDTYCYENRTIDLAFRNWCQLIRGKLTVLLSHPNATAYGKLIELTQEAEKEYEKYYGADALKNLPDAMEDRLITYPSAAKMR
jgi:curved DNA-binding protein CbpA